VNLHAAVTWREFDRVVDQIPQHLLQPPGVALLWSGVSFIGFALNNVLVFADYVVVPDVDLSLLRAAVACAAVSLLLFGLVTEAS
jgi:Family of unknown function (DUF5985)